MDQIALPEKVKKIIDRLEGAVHEAYAVGGAVRDSILGRTPSDWDVTTSALPEDTMALFGENAEPTGLKHGTVTVKCGGQCVEVTTFRVDGQYSDHRRPDSVIFTSSLRDDLSRRDFTMNALALGSSGEITDPFGGADDIKSGVIRCVGRAEKRFEEDALRMFRAVRFAAQLGFKPDDECMAALKKKARLADGLAVERIRDELEKTICSSHPEKAAMLFENGLMDRFLENRFAGGLDALCGIKNEMSLRWAGLCAILSGAGSIEAGKFLAALRCSNALVSQVESGVSFASEKAEPCRAEWKTLMSRYGAAAAECAAAAAFALRGDRKSADTVAEIASSGECFTLRSLAVGGRDCAGLGLAGQAVGAALNMALEHVIENPQDNERKILLSLIAEKNGIVR